MILRDYQLRCIEETRAAFGRAVRSGSRSVCIVAPTGAGKTVLGLEVSRRTLAARPDARVLWVAHRKELIAQAQDRAEEYLGDDSTRLAVATIQGLARSGKRPRADMLILDEAHHYGSGAAQWFEVAQHYSDAWRLGLTATPQRGDGSPLGDVFGEMVVAAQYGELVAAGHLVPCRVLRPDRQLGSSDLAQSPAEAWRTLAGDRQGFLFGGRVDECDGYAAELNAAGIAAEVISEKTPPEERDLSLADFKAGRIRVLCSVYVLTEGVDVPAAEVCMLARGCQHAGTYLQMVGRVLRPAPGKAEALLLDLTGVSWAHGMPTDDREYALEGRAIKTKGQVEREEKEAGEREDRKVTIHNLELREVYAGADTPKAARDGEWARLVELCRSRGFGLAWAAKEYQKLFDRCPPASMQEKSEALASLRAFAEAKGYKPGAAAHRYRDAFGVWPRGV